MPQAPKLQMKQTLGLKMTPELQLSLKILQFDIQELGDFIYDEIEANPVLELDPEYTNPARSDDLPKKAGPDISEIEGVVRVEQTLQDFISDQLAYLHLAPKEKIIAGHLAGNLNTAGYMITPLSEISENLGCKEEDVLGVLLALQKFEPPGVFARDLPECLRLQLKDLGPKGKAALSLLDHLPLVAKGDFSGLEKTTGLKGKTLEDAIHLLRELDPKPGLRFASGDPVQTLVPDIFIRETKNGAFVVELNPETLPKILINETYSSDFKKKKLGNEGKEFLQTCRQRAGWLKRALDQRAKTTLAVAEALLKNQIGFFEKGISNLKPLTFREIAGETKFHESTISRVVANKYLSCPKGVFPLKYFFASGVATAEGDGGTSSHAIKARIKTLIAEEPQKKPLSDGKLTSILQKEGIQISRRTVMKYREALGLPSSFERKKITNF